jgi:hypothetical protein
MAPLPNIVTKEMGAMASRDELQRTLDEISQRVEELGVRL